MFIKLGHGGQVINADFIRDFGVFANNEVRITFQDGVQFHFYYATGVLAQDAYCNISAAIESCKNYMIIDMGKYSIKPIS